MTYRFKAAAFPFEDEDGSSFDSIPNMATATELAKVPKTIATGTAQGGTSSTIQLASAETFADDELNGNIVYIHTGTGAGQSRWISDYTGSTDTATITPDWTTTPDNTSQYEVVAGTTAVGVWTNATRTLTSSSTSTIAAVTGLTLGIKQSVDIEGTLSGLTIPAYTKLWVSVKKNRGDSENNAWLRLEDTVGLERIFKAAPTDAVNGTLTVDRGAGTIDIWVAGVETAKLTTFDRQLVLEVKVLATDGSLTEVGEGTASVTGGIGLATS